MSLAWSADLLLPTTSGRMSDLDAHEQATFTALLGAYRQSGGLARHVLRQGRNVEPANLEICFEHSGSLWMPMFQFETSSWTLKASCRAVLVELQASLTGGASRMVCESQPVAGERAR